MFWQDEHYEMEKDRFSQLLDSINCQVIVYRCNLELFKYLHYGKESLSFLDKARESSINWIHSEFQDFPKEDVDLVSNLSLADDLYNYLEKLKCVIDNNGDKHSIIGLRNSVYDLEFNYKQFRNIMDKIDQTCINKLCCNWNSHLTDLSNITVGCGVDSFNLLVSAVPYLGSVRNNLVHCRLIDENSYKMYQDRSFGYLYELDYNNLITMGFTDLGYEYVSIRQNEEDELIQLLLGKEILKGVRTTYSSSYDNKRAYNFDKFKRKKTDNNEIVFAENQNWVGIVYTDESVSLDKLVPYSNRKPVVLLKNGVLKRVY